MAEADEVREKADEILSRPEYLPESESLLDRGFRWVNEQIRDLLGSIFGQTGSTIVGWIVLALALAAIIYLLWRVMPRSRLSRQAPDVVLERSELTRAGRAEWLSQAEQAEDEGNWAEAVRARYRATVAALIDRREVDDQLGATSGEYRRSFKAPPQRKEPFGTVTDRFEEVWYGGATAQAHDAELLRRLDDSVLEGTSTASSGTRRSISEATAESRTPTDRSGPDPT